MLMSKIYVPFVPNERDHRKLSEVLNRLCAFNRKKPLTNVLVLFNRTHNPVLCILLLTHVFKNLESIIVLQSPERGSCSALQEPSPKTKQL